MKGIFFTDIDGTLIDHFTYSFAESLEGINLLKERGIPLVPVSSKTYDEICILMDELDLAAPFVFENGCGIAYPDVNGYRFETAGEGVSRLREVLRIVEEYTGEKALPLADILPEDICRLTGLSMEKALLALKRKASLPFILEGRNLLSDGEIAGLGGLLSQHGAILTKGGRFNHLLPAGTGKGEAVKRIADFYYNCMEYPLTGAAGDSLNDLAMLRAVNRGYLVRKPDGSHIKETEGLHVTVNSGPAGFTEAVKDYLEYIMV
jgi:mannosyl-3-phosphoglycerate phosphatase